MYKFEVWVVGSSPTMEILNIIMTGLDPVIFFTASKEDARV